MARVVLINEINEKITMVIRNGWVSVKLVMVQVYNDFQLVCKPSRHHCKLVLSGGRGSEPRRVRP